MKNYFLKIILVMLPVSIAAQSIKLMTYNIRYATVNDGANQWEERKDFVASQLLFYEPEVFGIQEGLFRQVAYLDKSLQAYSYVGVGRDDGKQKGEYCAVFYNHDKIQLLSDGTFWLSETPSVVSKGWDAALERICTHALLMDKSSGAQFWVFNTHFDHIGVKAREKSAELIVQKIREINKEGLPVFIMGDFNLNDKSAPIRYLSSQFDDARQVTLEKPFGPFGTFTAFAFDQPVQDRIDYIFCSPKKITVNKYGVLTDSKNGRYPSDHFPVMVKTQLNSSVRKN